MFEIIKKELDLIYRHLMVLMLVKNYQPIGIIKLAEMTKIPQHRIRYSLRVLEKKGIIKPSIHGAIISDKNLLENFLYEIINDIEEIENNLKKLRKLIEKI